ncbi:chitobiase/beta-hexosaminidase C-terminal domain-containing protein [Paenibacillus sp.]|uniref:chitobiase/beta-hexosaminidase C-terminal domain-containing protein n=1 Tax=Paenibacillus sp. TaxID=58172 RepID=UPI00281246EB|nr:chitobiase/beta-hexosaminidase C-terminal domain-containing protein [Paenibacillus sp.]
MKRNKKWVRWTSLALAAAISASPLSPAAVPSANATGAGHLVISEVYGGGGNSGSTWRSDFIELYNPTETAVNVTGWTIQYASSSGSFSLASNMYVELTGIVAPHGYYLVKAADGSGGNVSLPSPDDEGGIAMAAGSGKVALVSNGEAIAGKDDPDVVDFVGYGGAGAYEGSGGTPTPSSSVSAQRKSDAAGYVPGQGNGYDANDNKTDFFTAAPTPRNAASPAEPPLGDDVVAGVSASPAPGAVERGTEVTLSSATVTATVYYSVYAADGAAIVIDAPYAGPIPITQATTIEAYAQKGAVRSEVRTFAYDVVETLSIAEARTLPANAAASIEGVVTYKESAGGQNNLYVQDETAGIVVRGANLTPNPGDRIRVSGTLTDYFGLAQLQTAAGQVAVLAPQAGVPAPIVVDSRGFAEPNEARLVKLESATIGPGNEFNEFTIQDEYGAAIVKSGWIESGKTYDQIAGVLTYSFGDYMLVPRNRFDVVEKTFSVIAETPPGIVPPGTGIALFSPQPGAAVYYTTDGSEPTPETGTPYAGPIVVRDDEVTIRAIAAVDGKVSEVYSFHYVKQKTYEGLAIHDVQSAGHASPFEGHKVNDLEGIVTQRIGTSKFYMQTVTAQEDGDDRTSEAILVYSSYSVAPGDRVLVDGTVEERKEEGYDDANDLLTTAIGSAFVTRASRGNALPAPVALERDRMIPKSIVDNDGMTVFDPEEDALDFYESLESMRLELRDARVVGPLDYEIPVVLGEQPGETMTPNGGILLTGEDLNPQRVLVKKEVDGYKTGDRFLAPIVGVLGYDYSNFKVIPEGNLPAAEKGAATRERTSIAFDEDKLTIAGFNIENFWDNPSASGAEKKRKIALAIVENLNAPDIIGLIEVQDNNGQTDDGTTDASKSYEALIAAIAAAGGPKYAYTDIAPENNRDGGAPGGNIRVGYLYNPDRVTLTEKPRGDATTAVSYDKKYGLSHNPGRIAPTNDAFDSSRKPLAAEFEFKGERVIVVNNHFNSKGGDEAPFGAVQPLPPTLGSEAQRHKIANVVNDFVAGVLKEDHKANVVLLGDFNDFQFSKTLDLLKGDELVNMVDLLPLPERYSYVYQGNSQTLDSFLVTERLAPATTLDIIHINADFSERDGRVSDHDPLLAQVDLFARGVGNGKGQGYENGKGTKK